MEPTNSIIKYLGFTTGINDYENIEHGLNMVQKMENKVKGMKAVGMYGSYPSPLGHRVIYQGLVRGAATYAVSVQHVNNIIMKEYQRIEYEAMKAMVCVKGNVSKATLHIMMGIIPIKTYIEYQQTKYYVQRVLMNDQRFKKQ